MESKEAKIVHLPDIEYTRWLNLNKKFLSEIERTNQIPTQWLNKDSNKRFLVRYFREKGYTITLTEK